MNVKDAVPGSYVKSGQGCISNVCSPSLSFLRVPVCLMHKPADRATGAKLLLLSWVSLHKVGFPHANLLCSNTGRRRVLPDL